MILKAYTDWQDKPVLTTTAYSVKQVRQEPK
jgi:hypothetical protein